MSSYDGKIYTVKHAMFSCSLSEDLQLNTEVFQYFNAPTNVLFMPTLPT